MTGPSDFPESRSSPGESSSSTGVGTHARGLADDLKSSAAAAAEDRKTEGAERLHGIAGTVDKIADEVAAESPATADFVRKAARGLDDVSRELKTRSVGDLLDMAKSFAHREPAAFLAASSVAGFALARLLKSSARETSARRPMSSGADAGVQPRNQQWRKPGVDPASSSSGPAATLGDMHSGSSGPASSIQSQDKRPAL